MPLLLPAFRPWIKARAAASRGIGRPGPRSRTEALTTKLKHVYLVDGSGYIFRAYHALPPLTRPDGKP